MRLPLPYLLLGALLAALGIYFYGHHKGWSERDAQMQMEIARKNDEARAKELAMNEQLNANAIKLTEANHALDQKSSALDRAIRAGRVRLPAPSCVQASTSAPAATGDRDEAASESERQTLAAIAAIVADGDKSIVQLNACIDAYNQVKEAANGQR